MYGDRRRVAWTNGFDGCNWFRRRRSASATERTTRRKAWESLLPRWSPSGRHANYKVPDWVIICCALAMAGGTMAGGWRVVKTMGQRITKLNPFGGFAAETSAAMTLIGTASAGIPVSSTHVITGAISGVGASRANDGGAMGSDAAHYVGVDFDDSRRGIDGRAILLSVSELDAMR